MVVWLICLVWDWFVRPEAVLPGWFQGLGVVVLGYLLGIDLIANLFKRSRGER